MQGLTIGVFVKSAEAQIEKMYYEKGDWKGTRTITANVGTEGAVKIFLFWDIFKELSVTQPLLH
jgi:hypothetical protein